MNLSPALPRDENEPLTIPSASSNEVCNQADGGIHIAQFESASAENDDRNTHISKGKSTKTKLNVTIRGWNGVATWKWIANDDTCGICRVAFDGCCPGMLITVLCTDPGKFQDSLYRTVLKLDNIYSIYRLQTSWR